jgi:hypothetical protein
MSRKAYLFVEGERRSINPGEWYLVNGKPFLWDHDDSTKAEFIVLTRYKGEIPDDSEGVVMLPVNHLMPVFEVGFRKKKVKRCQWLYRTRTGNYVSAEMLTEEEAEKTYSADLIRPIKETMIEEEE